MTASLQCPTCSAPLDPPGPHTRAMKCPYCGATALLTEQPGSVEARAGHDPHTEVIADVVRLLRGAGKVSATEVYRTRLGAGLEEARGAVERIEAGQRTGPERTASPVPGGASRGASGGRGYVIGAAVVALAVAGVFVARRGAGSGPETAPLAAVPGAAAPALPAPGGVGGPEAGALARPVLRFGSEGTGAGRFEDARSVAVDGAGRVYVAEYGGGRVQVFDSLGTFLTQWMADERMPLLDLAADRDGTVYVVQSGRIHLRDGATGEPRSELRPPGRSPGYDDVALALDGSLWAVTGDARLIHLARDGRVLGAVDVREAVGEDADPTRVAVSGAGHLYVLDRWSGEVYHLDADGRFVDRFGGRGAGTDGLDSPSDVVLDGRGRLYVSDLGRGIRVYDADGHPLGAVAPAGVVFGLAITDRDELYATYRNDHEVAKFRIAQ